MSATLRDSVTNLVDQVARLAQNIDRLVTIIETHKQRDVSPRASNTHARSERGMTQANVAAPAENAVAAKVADLYERLGGFIEPTVESKPRSGT